ncbi:response regulator transcription factor [Fontisphaera persica]|uniref:response regulator n=1 Tax=Fontisphaera persica TaxID=2974023 RepID=UPI0024BFFB5B|nr:response regulator transcription factor [Fontisphaera persica]WCJ60509.1 response regulator transcription factor [Fontisphaera persica]
MKVLLAEDELASREMLETILRRMGLEVVACGDGETAWELLQSAQRPSLAVLDWRMPGLDGDEICRRVRSVPALRHLYLILVTGLSQPEHIVAGLEAGANDYLTKPFNPVELEARVKVGLRVLQLQDELIARIRELELAMSHVKRLQGLLPICVMCKKVRNDDNYWQQVDAYFAEHANVRFNRALCPECAAREARKFE